ncbi:MAG: protein of unknown function (DUF1814) [Haloquadratum walsbyi J07HQW2]|uniref:Uncharacterized protein n=1 Tax=Haloquadratum walsbyi J07HQW2 TaxID=1238425 RepID=U1NK82_9EURY|nr:MAG: protein of unknown function (DUF1814) [Haloquadratum walsbyi J07HQW2]
MYIGYYSALSHHGLTEQVPRTVYVVTSTRAQNREIHGVPYRVTTLTERKFFGFEPTSIEGTTVQVSDLEKTLVDCANHHGFCGGLREVATAMRTVDERRCDQADRLPHRPARHRPPRYRRTRRVVHEWLFPAGPDTARHWIDRQHVSPPDQRRASHAGADGVLIAMLSQDRPRILARELGVRQGYAEKNYVNSWLLWGIFTSDYGDNLLFKGGTALSKLYVPQSWRFSEDVDFGVEGEYYGSKQEFRTVLETISDRSGIEFEIREHHESQQDHYPTHYVDISIQYQTVLNQPSQHDQHRRDGR